MVAPIADIVRLKYDVLRCPSPWKEFRIAGGVSKSRSGDFSKFYTVRLGRAESAGYEGSSLCIHYVHLCYHYYYYHYYYYHY